MRYTLRFFNTHMLRKAYIDGFYRGIQEGKSVLLESEIDDLADDWLDNLTVALHDDEAERQINNQTREDEK